MSNLSSSFFHGEEIGVGARGPFHTSEVLPCTKGPFLMIMMNAVFVVKKKKKKEKEMPSSDDIITCDRLPAHLVGNGSVILPTRDMHVMMMHHHSSSRMRGSCSMKNVDTNTVSPTLSVMCHQLDGK